MDQKGFAPLIVIVIATLVIGAGVGSFLVLREKKVPSSEKMVQQEVSPQKTEHEIPLPEMPSISLSPSALGNLCSGEDGCNDYCKNNFGQCQKYCEQYPGNKLCLKPFQFQSITIENVSENASQVKSKKQLVPVVAPTEPLAVKPETVKPEKKGCRGAGPVSLTSAPINIEDLFYIVPLGQMYGDHVTPTDHGYYITHGWKLNMRDLSLTREVLSPADGVITEIGSMSGKTDDYRLVIYHTCTFITVYIHLQQLSPKILQATGGVFTDHKYPALPIAAGEMIGRASGFDFSVHNEETKLKGFIIPEHYEVEPWKIHTVDMFDSFIEPIRSQLLAKNIRQAEPRSGKIDYDIDGKLVGTWFREGTSGYRGGGYDGAEPYWASHLTLAYNNLDPTLIMISVGDFEGKSRQFAVKDNAPDPADISVSGGPVKYELIEYDFLTDQGQLWDRTSFARVAKVKGFGPVRGVALMQMIGDRKIKFEGFLGKTAAEVAGFTNAAKIYER